MRTQSWTRGRRQGGAQHSLYYLSLQEFNISQYLSCIVFISFLFFYFAPLVSHLHHICSSISSSFLLLLLIHDAERCSQRYRKFSFRKVTFRYHLLTFDYHNARSPQLSLIHMIIIIIVHPFIFISFTLLDDCLSFRFN